MVADPKSHPFPSQEVAQREVEYSQAYKEEAAIRLASLVGRDISDPTIDERLSESDRKTASAEMLTDSESSYLDESRRIIEVLFEAFRHSNRAAMFRRGSR